MELQGGDHRAFKEIYERYADKLIAFALKKTQNEDEATDMVQELFLSVWKNRYTIQINGAIEAYLMVSINYMAYKWYRKRSTRPQSLNDFAELPEVAEDSTAQKLSFTELNFLINQEIADMPEKMRQVYLYSREHDMNGQQIATELGISHQTVRNQISSALARLKKIVNQYNNVIPLNNVREFLLLIFFFNLL
nr:sigma-70 family RNA polymerase sigma factor [Mucilaginibacter sp. FT3.2]